MKKSRYTEEQIAFAPRQVETGTPVAEVFRKMGVSEQIVYRRERQYAGMAVGEIRRLMNLDDENRKLKQLVADVSLDELMLQQALSKTL
jgi:putative transposase